MSGSANFISPYDLGNLLAPVDGNTHAAKFNVSLAGNSANISIASIQQTMGNFQPQSVMVDNSQNTSPLILQELIFGWEIPFPAGTINWINFPAVNNALFVVSSAGSITATVSFFDFPALPFSINNPANQAGQDVNIINTPVPVSITSGSIGGAVTYSDASVTSTGASQELVAANAARKYLLIGAPEASEIWVNFSGGTAGPNLTGCFQIGAGGFYESNIYVPGNEVTVYCATASLVIPCSVG